MEATIGVRRRMTPGLARAVLGAVIGVIIGLAPPALAAAAGLVVTPAHLLLFGYLGGLVGWLAGIGAFRFWLAWALGRPIDRAEEHAAHGRADDRSRYLRFTTDHKVIGLQYLTTFLVLLFIAGAFALIMRLELALPGQQLLDRDTYNTIMSTHGTLMIFVALNAIVGGLGNYLVPLMIGARDMAFPKLNALSYWLVPPALLVILLNPLLGGYDTGWTAYPPLSERANLGEQAFVTAFVTLGVSSILSAVNFLVTVAGLRAPGMTLSRLPIFVWSLVVTASIALLATSVVAAGLTMVLFDRLLGTSFFAPKGGGDPMLFQHLFWFYSHPAVYIMAVPAFGAILEVTPVFARKPLFAYPLAVASFIAIGILSFMVWAHHMFVSGMADFLHIPIMVTTELISVPTGIVFLSALGTIWLGRIRFAPPMLWVYGFLWCFLIGGVTGVYLADVPTNIYLTDSYFVVAHFHYTIVGGMIFGLFAAFYYWFPKLTGRVFPEVWAKAHFWLFFFGFNATFLPMFVLGIEGMRRRVADYPPELGALNLWISGSAYVIGIAMLLFATGVVRAFRSRVVAEANPWRARTLEWQVGSPPPVENFERPPIVTGGPYDYGAPLPGPSTVAPQPLGARR
jgi:cytochrome c oxidase subunit 1